MLSEAAKILTQRPTLLFRWAAISLFVKSSVILFASHIVGGVPFTLSNLFVVAMAFFIINWKVELTSDEVKRF